MYFISQTFQRLKRELFENDTMTFNQRYIVCMIDVLKQAGEFAVGTKWLKTDAVMSHCAWADKREPRLHVPDCLWCLSLWTVREAWLISTHLKTLGQRRSHCGSLVGGLMPVVDFRTHGVHTPGVRREHDENCVIIAACVSLCMSTAFCCRARNCVPHAQSRVNTHVSRCNCFSNIHLWSKLGCVPRMSG